MSVVVEFNPETYQTLFKDVLVEHPELLQNLKQDFIDYVESDGHKLPDYFGKDSPYMQPYVAAKVGLMHIHIAIPPVSFQRNKPQHARKCPQGDPAKDAALVYVRGELYDNHYSLIALLHPGAHDEARKDKVMRYLIAVAERFQERQYQS